MLSIVIPVFNESASIEVTLKRLQSARTKGAELLLVDGGSTDNTLELAEPWVDHLLSSSAGRARQMNKGGEHARGNFLLFLHADTLMPADYERQIARAGALGYCWGFFPVSLTGRQRWFRVIEFFMNLRSRSTSVATGDQGIFVERDHWLKQGGFADIPLMEDVELSKRLRKVTRPYVATSKLITSSRRWEDYGILNTVILMWRLRWKYFRGCDPAELKREYL